MNILIALSVQIRRDHHHIKTSVIRIRDTAKALDSAGGDGASDLVFFLFASTVFGVLILVVKLCFGWGVSEDSSGRLGQHLVCVSGV